MLKKTAIVGLTLILVSGALFEWTRRRSPPLHQLFPEVANDMEIDYLAHSGKDLEDYQNVDQFLAAFLNRPLEEIKKEQKLRLITNIGRLATDNVQDPILAETLYGPNWQAKVARYKRLTKQQEFTAIASIVLGTVGIVTMIITIICVAARMIRIIMHASVHAMTERDEKKAETISDELLDTQPDAVSKKEVPLIGADERPQCDLGRYYRPLGSGVTFIPEAKSSPLSSCPDNTRGPWLGHQAGSDEAGVFDLFLTDQGSVPTRNRIDCDDPSFPMQCTGNVSEAIDKSMSSSSLEERTDDVVRQISQVQNLVTKNETETPLAAEPFNDTLNQLNDQISAIRQYASSQQDRVEKLQNGYDWNIIRTFCLRIIRCIDNLNDRIERLPDDSDATEMLCDIRDELLFSLESSGVEQFELEHDSEFCGQERMAEAIKEKEASDDPQKKGRIACVIKPGYQYVIDEGNVKIVRTARVKLYG